ncbi:hypothetical protein GKZ90_0007530 [Flavobacterium sp. MC2016-06]|jgi:hypothetical protein|uniref:hypothetical protein n=1 Tax=Flavobacterium sp. MC2016-06 TaxID=2676308 RepID=UPI0012BB0F88|nr:hypothetical protein [Flavobacterium sp. MC2016-06]MBU3858121.1 hypothetical protein [Flavobacterium sp. MC2016-06]
MNQINVTLRKSVYLMLALALGTLTSCDDEVGSGNGLTAASVDAAFTVTPVAGAVNTYLLTAQPKGVISSTWNTGDGAYQGKMDETISLPDAGTYTITHTAIGAGGATGTATAKIVVATSDPVKGNLVKGGSFVTADDQANWKKVVYVTGGNWTYSANGATVTTAHAGIYQAIDVVKDKEYTIDMTVNGGASTDMWFEVYAGKADPAVTAGDYSDGGVVMGLNTWNGCGKTAVSGKLSAVGCITNKVQNKISNVVKFDSTGKIYLMIRSGGGIAAGGITIKSVELRGK